MNVDNLAHRALFAGTSIVAIALANPAFAQEQTSGAEVETPSDSATGQNTILVTARKREESITDVPVSITALGGDRLDNLGIDDVSEMVQLVPAVRIVAQPLGSSAFIRGAGSGSFNPGFEQTVGFFTDGAYYSRGAWNRQGQLDVERVEVLKGPQGVLFGKNTVGGAINTITRNPTSSFEAYARLGYEFEASDELTAEAVVSGPVDDDGTLGARLAVRYSDQSQGYIENLSPRGFDGPITDQFLARGTLVWEPSESFDANFKVTYIDSTTRGVNVEVFRCGAVSPPSPTSPPSLNLARFFGATSEDCTANFRNSLVNLDSGTAEILSQQTSQAIDPVESGEQFEGLSLTNTMNLQLGDLTLTSVTSYITHDQNIVTEIDNSDVPFSTLDRTENYESITQEVRLASSPDDRLSWVIGGYYEHSDLVFDEFNSVYLTAFPGFPPAPGPVPPSGTYTKLDEQSGTSWALFGEATLNITEQLDLSVGLRYTNESKDIDHQICIGLLHRPTCGTTADDTPLITPLFAEHLLYTDSFEDDNLSPAVTLRWRPNPDVMLYASFKQGFKAGGFDFETRALPAGLSAGPPTRVDSDGDGIPDSFQFESESVDSYELGGSFTLANGDLQVGFALFQNNFSNLQTAQFDGVVGFNTINAGESRSRGLEIDTLWRAAPGLTFGGSLSILNSEFLDFPGAQCPSDAGPGDATGTTPTGTPSCNLAGRSTAFAPDIAFSLNGDYVQPLSDSIDLALSVDAQWSDEYFLENTGEPLNMQDAFWKLGGRIALQSDHWELALIGRNLTNSITYSHGTSVPLAGPGYFMGFIEPSRTIMVQGTIRY